MDYLLENFKKILYSLGFRVYGVATLKYFKKYQPLILYCNMLRHFQAINYTFPVPPQLGHSVVSSCLYNGFIAFSCP